MLEAEDPYSYESLLIAIRATISFDVCRLDDLLLGIFVGPALFWTATAWFQWQRAGMATVLVMFVIGGLLLARVREPARG